MIRALLFLIAVAAAHGGCTIDHVLLAPRDLSASSDGAVDDGSIDASTDAQLPQTFAFCPVNIDIYGDENVLLSGCGGPSDTPTSTASGYFSPGTASYDATLAGRLQARLAADRELVALFGSQWKVRSCAAAGATLAAMSTEIAADQCGAPEAPASMATRTDACSDLPAPMLLLSADGADDGCHGGGTMSVHADDKASFSAHFATRLQSFLVARHPFLALVGPRTEWYQDPGAPLDTDGGVVTAAACGWKRGDWDESGVRQWEALHPSATSVFVVGHLHDECKLHHPCCSGATCGSSWFTDGPSGPTLLNCDGAQAMVDFWFGHLKQTLLANHFTCP